MALTHCTVLISIPNDQSISHRTMRTFFDMEVDYESYSQRYSSSGHIQIQPRLTAERGPPIGQQVVDEQKQKILDYCHIGIYIAMCKIILEK